MNRALLLALLLAAPAFASASFPTAVKTHLSLGTEPPQSCSLCHLNGVTGIGTVNTLFGVSLRAHGAVALDEAKLGAALDAMRTDNTDSDGDGVPDVQELINGTDPNVPEGGTKAPSPRYGCGANAVPGLLAGGALVLLTLRRRRREA